MTTDECITALTALSEQYKSETYIGSRKILNPLLLDVWSDDLPAGTKVLLESFMQSLTHRDLSSSEELRGLITKIEAQTTVPV